MEITMYFFTVFQKVVNKIHLYSIAIIIIDETVLSTAQKHRNILARKSKYRVLSMANTEK
jgi:hypothetical protein